jgi:hypothetical protein
VLRSARGVPLVQRTTERRAAAQQQQRPPTWPLALRPAQTRRPTHLCCKRLQLIKQEACSHGHACWLQGGRGLNVRCGDLLARAPPGRGFGQALTHPA